MQTTALNHPQLRAAYRTILDDISAQRSSLRKVLGDC